MSCTLYLNGHPRRAFLYILEVPTTDQHFFQQRTVFFDTAEPWNNEWSVGVLKKLAIFSPDSGQIVTTCEVFIDWSNVADADRYMVELYNIDLGTMTSEPFITESQFMTYCLDNGLYSLTITAVDDETRHIARNAGVFTVAVE